MSEYAPNIAPVDDGSGVPTETTQDAPEPAPITEQEVGEYREQDRFLPVSEPRLPSDSSLTSLSLFTPASLGPTTDASVGRLQMWQG